MAGSVVLVVHISGADAAKKAHELQDDFREGKLDKFPRGGWQVRFWPCDSAVGGVEIDMTGARRYGGFGGRAGECSTGVHGGH